MYFRGYKGRRDLVCDSSHKKVRKAKIIMRQKKEELSRQGNCCHLLQIMARKQSLKPPLQSFLHSMEKASYAEQPVLTVSMNEKTHFVLRDHYTTIWIKNTFLTWNASGTLV